MRDRAHGVTMQRIAQRHARVPSLRQKSMTCRRSEKLHGNTGRTTVGEPAADGARTCGT